MNRELRYKAGEDTEPVAFDTTGEATIDDLDGAHGKKIVIFGKDRDALRSRILKMLNAEEQAVADARRPGYQLPFSPRDELAIRFLLAWHSDNETDFVCYPSTDGAWVEPRPRAGGKSMVILEAAYGWADAVIAERERQKGLYT